MRSSGVSSALWLALASAPFVSAKLGLNYGRVDAVGEALVRPWVRESVVSVGWVVVGLWLGCSSLELRRRRSPKIPTCHWRRR